MIMTDSEYKLRFIDTSDLEIYEDNPRFIKDKEFEDLVRNIKEDANFFNARPCLVNHTEGRYIVYAGAQRLRASQAIGMETVPCFVEDELETEVMRKRNLLDNWHAGKWDLDVLANKWDIEELLAIGEGFLKDLNIPDLLEDVEDGETTGSLKKITYEIVFDNQEQKQEWDDFETYLKYNGSGATFAERLIGFVTDRK
jgi:hypothetical protein